MSRATRTIKVAWRIVRFLVVLVIAFVCGLLIWRISAANTPKTMSDLTVNETLAELYAQNGEQLTLLTQEQNTITRGADNYGYFSVPEHVLIPDANQVQVVFRYNNSTISALYEDYSLPEMPSREAELFDVTILLAIDLTPEDDTDNAGNDPASVRFVRVHAGADPRVERTGLYNYRRFSFDLTDTGEDLKALMDSGLLLAIYADVYYNQDIQYDETPYGALCLYDYKSENQTVNLSGNDRKALKNFGKD